MTKSSAIVWVGWTRKPPTHSAPLSSTPFKSRASTTGGRAVIFRGNLLSFVSRVLGGGSNGCIAWAFKMTRAGISLGTETIVSWWIIRWSDSSSSSWDGLRILSWQRLELQLSRNDKDTSMDNLFSCCSPLFIRISFTDHCEALATSSSSPNHSFLIRTRELKKDISYHERLKLLKVT